MAKIYAHIIENVHLWNFSSPLHDLIIIPHVKQPW